MNNKYSLAKREQYGRLLAALLCDQHFGARPTATLDGPAVLRFTPIRQINLFVVQRLLGQWMAEMGNLRSPYFDFEDAEVRQALTQFMNVLSRRIKLSRPVFEPLLADSICDTLLGAIDPAETFSRKLMGEQTSASPQKLRETLRYLDLNKPLFEGFLDTLPAEQVQERDYLLSRFRLYLEHDTQELQPLSALVQEFNALLPLTEADLYEEGPPSTHPADKPKEAEEAAPAEKPAPAPAPTPAAVAEPAAPAPVPIPVIKAPAAPTEQRGTAAEPTSATAVPLYAKLQAEQTSAPSLSETLRSERPAAATLAEKAPKVETLREAISINQRFSFINELFNGENMEYHAVIQHLDTLPNSDSAKRYVTENLAAQYNWARKEEHVNKLLKLIERKFA
ncbi:hypothetical protein SAMN06265337_2376 [Hymenobacter gelipurpurascens]|uniref:Uncharacterized protein n=1 Tax=Hymenobacter gelipurpurascens TaxID=89968 RepID=A0A212TRR6_9BACT|nr:hypothetical protein [Hymenobacter gelipurpurascens]SNC68561.1 hypothetical protein SAMN06265337_2376 [Hymenobacter gelipurpurascens]